MSKGTLRSAGTADMYYAVRNLGRGRSPDTLDRNAENAPQRFMASVLGINTMGKESATERIKGRLRFAGERANLTWEAVSDLYGPLARQVDALGELESLKKRYEDARLFVFTRRKYPSEDKHVGVSVNGGMPTSAYSAVTYTDAMRGDFNKVHGFVQRLKSIKEAVSAVWNHHIRLSTVAMRTNHAKRCQERIDELTANEEVMREEERALMKWFNGRPENLSANTLLGRSSHRMDEPTMEVIIYHFLHRQSFAYQMSQQQNGLRSAQSQIEQAEGASGVLLVDPARVQEAFEEWVDDVMEWLYTPTTTDGGEEE